jgi:hypothetical protein
MDKKHLADVKEHYEERLREARAVIIELLDAQSLKENSLAVERANLWLKGGGQFVKAEK